MKWIIERISTGNRIRRANFLLVLPEWWRYSLSPLLWLNYCWFTNQICLYSTISSKPFPQQDIKFFGIIHHIILFLSIPPLPSATRTVYYICEFHCTRLPPPRPPYKHYPHFLPGSLTKISQKFLVLLGKLYGKSSELMMLLDLVDTRKEVGM